MSSHGMVIETRPSDFHQDRLGLAIIIALALHAAVILGITFGTNDDKTELAPEPNIDVTLVTTQQSEEPEDADYLAQANQLGGGNTQEKVRPETMMPALVPQDSPQLTSPSPPVQTPAPAQRATRSEVLTVVKSETDLSADIFPEQQNDSETPSAAELISQSLDIASLEVEVGQVIQAYAEMPRRNFISANTREHRYAAYMDGWRRKVERIGTLNFPAEAKRQRLTGNLILEVAINPDGTINEIEVVRSSKHKILDDAAIRIVRLAAPFAPFPDNIRADTDVLHITRTWKFLGGDRVLTR